MEAQRELLRGSTPTLILAVLRDGPRHGYGIAREIEQRSGHSLQCREGTLYPMLRTLEEEGLIRGEWQLAGERQRKVYSLTPEGQAALEQRARTWEAFVGAVQRVLAGADPAEKTGGSGNEVQPEIERERVPGYSSPLRPEPAA